MCDLIFSGVFERHPRLTLAIVEFELAWAPHLLSTMETLVAIDAVTNDLYRLALDDTLKIITPTKILLYSDQPQDWQSG